MIDIATLKKEIENNTLLLDDSSFIIFKGKDISSEFIFDQYSHVYANNNMLDIEVLDELADNHINCFGVTNCNLKIFKTEKLEYVPLNFEGWIYCKSVSKNIDENRIVELPKLEKWQLLDYISSKCKISIEQATILVDTYKDLYKLDIESNKLIVFNNNMFNIIEDQLIQKNDYVLFDLVNAILQRDKNKLKLIYNSGLKVDTFAFLSLLIKNFRNVIDIQLARNATAESLGLSGKQFWAIRNYNCNKYSREELIYIYDLLTSMDLRIKTGKINTNKVQDYIVFKIIFL